MELKSYLGVYSSSYVPGVKQDSNEDAQSYLCFVWETSWFACAVQRVDEEFCVTHQTINISRVELDKYFIHQPQIVALPMDAQGDNEASDIQETKEENFYAPHLPYTEDVIVQAVKLDRELRVDFFSALAMYKKGIKSKAMQAFEVLVLKQGLIMPHKHTYTEFGVELRRLGLLTLALKVYQRVLELEPSDAHARCNVGRMYYEMKQFAPAMRCAGEALKRQPDLEYAKQLLWACDVKQRLPSNRTGSSYDPTKYAF